MKLERPIVHSVLPTLLAIACLATALAAAEINPTPAFPPAVVKALQGQDPAKVKELSLWTSAIRDEDLAALKPLTQLESLDLTSTKVSDAGLEHLKTLTKLKMLDLTSTQVSDAGLKHLKTLTQLRGLSLTNTKVTNAGVDALKKSLPKCSITR